MGASEFKNYPFLNGEEFIEVCHLLDRRYCQTSIGTKRRQWRLDVIRALNVSFSLGPEYNTYISIIDSIIDKRDDGGLSSCLEALSFRGSHPTMDVDMDDDAELAAAEKDDELFVISGNPTPDMSEGTVIGKVKYDIILHPTYQVPCLWFALSGLKTGENPFDIEVVFRYLVPEEYKSRLRSAGPIGGISMDHHPITGLPAFFIHPCMVGEAMSEFDCSKETYLIVWMGLVGACIGLNVPSEMMLEQSELMKTGHSL